MHLLRSALSAPLPRNCCCFGRNTLYFKPNGQTFDVAGVQPHVTVHPTAAYFLTTSGPSDFRTNSCPKKDRMMDRALKVLKTLSVAAEKKNCNYVSPPPPNAPSPCHRP